MSSRDNSDNAPIMARGRARNHHHHRRHCRLLHHSSRRSSPPEDEIGLMVAGPESDSAARSMLRLSTERLRLKALGRRLGGGSLLKQTTCTLTLSVVFRFMACLTRPSAQCFGSLFSCKGSTSNIRQALASSAASGAQEKGDRKQL